MAKSEILGGEELRYSAALDGTGAYALANLFKQEGLLFSLRVIPFNSNHTTVGGSPTLTMRNGNDIIINNKQFTADTVCYPQAATQTIALVATGLYMPFLFVGNTSVVISGGTANGFVDFILKMYP